MTKALERKIGLPAPDAKVLTDIETCGWHVVRVFSQPGDEAPEWAYSIGLFHSFGHPEVIVFGLPLDRCHRIINEVGSGIKAGKKYESGPEYDDVLADPYKCVFRPVRQRYYRDHVGYALWFYEKDPFLLLQCFWPDKKGLFPWAADCNSYVKDAQPLLFLPDESRA